MEDRAISDYAVIGDTRTAALISRAGSIDWMCVPDFEGPPLFGRLVGGARGGSFEVAVDESRAVERRYRPRTAVLESRFTARHGAGRRADAMVVDVAGALLPQLVLVRRVVCDRGRLSVRIRFDPRVGLPGRPPRAAKRARALVCDWGRVALAVQASPELDLVPGADTEVELSAGTALTIVMTLSDRSPLILPPIDRAIELLDDTAAWWEEWASDITYDGPFAGSVLRSVVTLQLLTFSPSGAPVAAPTTSLPESIGGSRNWDYRFSWPRDAAIGLAGFLALGKSTLAHSYMHWLLHASRLTRPRLQVLYTLYGKPSPPEREIDGVPGYRGSLPVRVGNAASTQHQLDVYGWVVDAAWALTNAGQTLHAEMWRALSGFADLAAERWREPDAGIWEGRGDRRHYVHSKLMAWLCLDRALRMSRNHRTSETRRARWANERSRLAAHVRSHGFDRVKAGYVRAYGSDELDAALLLLPVLDFESDGTRVLGTISAIRRELEVDDGIVYRYRPGGDGMGGNEGAFLPCSFWLVQALARTGRRDEAARLFERLVGFANDVGLLSEEIDPSTRELLGNFPQAFTHAALIQAAMSLEDAGVD